MISEYIFYFLSFVAILSAIMVVVSKNPVHSVLYLIITFFSIAGHYFLLNAQFLGIVHIIVYAGAIMVLFLYVIMMLNLNKEVEPSKSNINKLISTIAGGLLAIVIIASLRKAEINGVPSPNLETDNIGFVSNLGKILFSDFLLPFELASILLLGAMIGSVFLSKKELN
jgi:NADH-quinone oxidoreductase subunit J